MTFPYIPASPAEEKEMLDAIGVSSFEDLLAPVPEALRVHGKIGIPESRSELDVVRDLTRWGDQNFGASRMPCFLGGGMYDHYIPSVIDHVSMRSEFYTAYTPYQSEVSQGTLIAIFEFQTMISELTGLPVANASLYDGASAAGEAALLAMGVTGRKGIVICGRFHPHYTEVVKTYVTRSGGRVVLVEAPDHVTDPDRLAAAVDDDTACVLVQNPNFFGFLEPVRKIREIASGCGALMVAAVDPLTLGLLAPPGEYGADLAIGECQPLGIPMSFGGPVAGFFAADLKYLRLMPGRLVGETIDRDGKRAFTLTLQTREQHIRREKATSNICTNQTLLAHRATIYMSLLGPDGIREVGEQCLKRSRYAASRIGSLPGFEVLPGNFVKEFVVKCPIPAADVLASGRRHGILAGIDLGRFDPRWTHLMLSAVTEKRNREEIETLVSACADAERRTRG